MSSPEISPVQLFASPVSSPTAVAAVESIRSRTSNLDDNVVPQVVNALVQDILSRVMILEGGTAAIASQLTKISNRLRQVENDINKLIIDCKKSKEMIKSNDARLTDLEKKLELVDQAMGFKFDTQDADWGKRYDGEKQAEEKIKKEQEESEKRIEKATRIVEEAEEKFFKEVERLEQEKREKRIEEATRIVKEAEENFFKEVERLAEERDIEEKEARRLANEADMMEQEERDIEEKEAARLANEADMMERGESDKEICFAEDIKIKKATEWRKMARKISSTTPDKTVKTVFVLVADDLWVKVMDKDVPLDVPADELQPYEESPPEQSEQMQSLYGEESEQMHSIGSQESYEQWLAVLKSLK